MLFWIICTVMCLVVAATVVTPLLRPQTGAATNPDIAIYKAQLSELDHDLATGLIDAPAAESARIEISRRLLAADAQGSEAAAGQPLPILALICVVVLTVGTLVGYGNLGARGYGDLPLAERHAAAKLARDSRPSQDALVAAAPLAPTLDIAPETLTLITQLRQIVPTRPQDIEGWRLLAEHEAKLRNYPAAARAQAHLNKLLGDQVTVQDRVALADMMVAAAGGLVSPEAEIVIDQVLIEDPENPAAVYYKGALYYQTDRADIAFQLWRRLVAEGDANTYHVAAARAQIESAAFLAGQDKYTLPPAAGPSIQDIENASELSDEDRQEMIIGMVNQLADRLSTDGGTAADWARLIAAHGVLGNMDQATAVYTEALEVFGNSETALATLRLAAQNAGIAP